MNFYIENKLVTLRGSSYVFDEANQKTFEVRGKLFSPTKKKFICDLNGNRLYMVRNKYWHLFRRHIFIYDLQGGKRKYLKLTKKFWRGYIIECEDDWALEGKFLQGISILKNGETVGRFARSHNAVTLLSSKDAYSLEVYAPADAALLVALVIGYDNIFDAISGTRD